MRKGSHRRAGFSLVEVALALGVAAFCLVAIFGLVPVGINSNKASIEETAATNILTSVVSDLRATPNPLPKSSTQKSSVFSIPIPFVGSTASATPTTLYVGEDGRCTDDDNKPLDQNSLLARYQLNVWMTVPAAAGTVMPRTATMARLLMTWPAKASILNAAGSVETLTALDRN